MKLLYIPCNPVTSAVALPLLSKVTRLTSTSSSGIAVEKKSPISSSVTPAGSEDKFRRTEFPLFSSIKVCIIGMLFAILKPYFKK